MITVNINGPIHLHLDGPIGDVAQQLLTIGEIYMATTQEAIARLRQEVQDAKTVRASVKSLLERYAQLIRDAANAPDEIMQLANEMSAETDGIAADVVANTPSSGEPPAGGGGGEGGGPVGPA